MNLTQSKLVTRYRVSTTKQLLLFCLLVSSKFFVILFTHRTMLEILKTVTQRVEYISCCTQWILFVFFKELIRERGIFMGINPDLPVTKVWLCVFNTISFGIFTAIILEVFNFVKVPFTQ